MKVEIGLTDVSGIGQKRSEKLSAAGINSVKALAGCKPEDLAKRVGASEKAASRWIENASELLSNR